MHHSTLQAAAVCVCQHLASIVHQPQDTAISKSPLPGRSKQKKKNAATSGSGTKKPVKATPPAAAVTAKPKPAAELPPPSPLVALIMEMGFLRKHIERAIEVRGWMAAIL